MRVAGFALIALMLSCMNALSQQLSPGLAWQQEGNWLVLSGTPRQGESSYRVSFSLSSMAEGIDQEWRLEEIDGSNVRRTEAIVPQNERTFWTWAIAGGAGLRLIPPTGMTKPPFEILEVRANLPPPEPQQKMQGSPQIPTRVLSTTINELATSVGFLFIGGKTADTEVCTAYLIDTDLVMTNEHCVAGLTSWNSLRFELGFFRSTSPILRTRLAKCELLDHDRDIAIARLAAAVSTAIADANDDSVKRVPKPLKLAPKFTEDPHPLMVIGHPGGGPQVSAFCSSNTDVSASSLQFDFRHSCSTEPGSSGSPIIDSLTKEVVGLHRGAERKNLAIRAEFLVEAMEKVKQGKGAC